jgi:hypothetical protein
VTTADHSPVSKHSSSIYFLQIATYFNTPSILHINKLPHAKPIWREAHGKDTWHWMFLTLKSISLGVKGRLIRHYPCSIVCCGSWMVFHISPFNARVSLTWPVLLMLNDDIRPEFNIHTCVMCIEPASLERCTRTSNSCKTNTATPLNLNSLTYTYFT